MKKYRVLHLTPHLGGGVGKALSSLLIEAIKSDSAFDHTLAILEAPEKNEWLTKVVDQGCAVHIEPELDSLKALIENADIVQLEWWNHPLIFSKE